MGRSSRRFLERICSIPTYRQPTPRLATNDLKIHQAELSPPLPDPPIIKEAVNGDPPPDRGKTTHVWPWPQEEV